MVYKTRLNSMDQEKQYSNTKNAIYMRKQHKNPEWREKQCEKIKNHIRSGGDFTIRNVSNFNDL